MTAAYDDDTISTRRQENAKNSDVPVDFNSQKIAALTFDKSTSEENGGTATRENSLEAGQNTEELSLSEPSLESKTVNTSTAGRSVDVGSVVGNKEDENCTRSTEQADSSETCLMLCKQKLNEEVAVSDKQEGNNFSIINSEISHTECDQKIVRDKFLDKKSYSELITNCSELKLSSTITSGNSKTEEEGNDFSYNLTDENKSQQFTIITSQEILIGDETSPVNCNPQQNGITIPSDESTSSESSNIKANFHHVINRKYAKPAAQSIYRPKSDSLDENLANYELTHDESFEDYNPECEMSFHEAVRAGDARSVEMLMARGAVQNIDEPDWNVSGDPPLLVAATNHSLPVLRTLLSNGCDPGVRSPRGETALHRAIINGNPSSVFELVEELLKHDCPSTVKEAGGGLTALHILTRQLAYAQSSKTLHHNFDIALRTLNLLAKVGPVDAKDHQGRSALHLLASSSTFGNSHKIEIEPMIKTLLDAGADPALKNDRGETPLHEALECGALNTAFLLIPHTPVGITSRYGETPLHIAARKNQPEVVDSLLKRGENPSFQDAGGNTPLHLASARGFHHTVSLLVTSPLAQLEKTNDDGLTSLQVAAESGFVNAVKLLLKAGADPSQTARYCVTTLHRHPDISVLIDHELTRRRQLAA